MLLPDKLSAISAEKDNKVIHPKPFLKWAGGKTQLLGHFNKIYPASLIRGEIETYIEPFLGSGAVFFNITGSFNIRGSILTDINPDLILTWQVIQNNVEKLIKILETIQYEYLSLNNDEREHYYYSVREQFNANGDLGFNAQLEDKTKRAAQLIFLNRTCFNGLYRVNSKGVFNSPFGKYSNPRICDTPNLWAVNQALQNSRVEIATFDTIINYADKNSFVYFDPPYRPISKSASFKTYSKNGFPDADQIRLAEVFRRLDQVGAKLMLSNSDPKNYMPDDNFFDELYRGFRIMRVPAKRLINSKAEKRGYVNEIIVTNYEPIL